MKKIFLILFLSYCAIQSMGQIVINPKGTKITIDSSKWKITGNDIFFKNSGNVGIGTPTPTAQLHTTNSVRFQGIGTNTTDTKILTADASGNITTRLLSSLPTNADSTTANNGLTLAGKNIQLGGNLIQPTVISNNEKPLTFATGGFPLNITGLTAGANTDSLVTVNTTTGKINRINLSTLNKADSTTSSNGLNLVGKDVRLGGNLTQATTITNNANPLTIATGGTALNITGLTAGAATDSLVTVNTTTGKINRINLATLNKADSTTSSNGLNLVGKDVRLGGNLTQATTITNNANPLTIATGGTALNITGLTAGAATDSLVTVNTTTGKINRINLATLNKADSTTSSNGLNLVGKDVRLGGNLTQATTITNNANPLTFATGGTALNITGLTAGANTDSLVTVNTTTGKINRINLATLNKADSTTSSNGLNLVGKDVRLGGNLTQATTITNNANPLTIATGGTALNITGLTSGANTDSLVTVNTTTGKINRINLATLNKADSTTSSNGLNLVGKDVRLGGNLTQATTITNNANPLTIATGGTALNITGLTAGATTDSLVTVNTTTGKINRINLSTLNKADSTTSSNGLNLLGKDVRLGGNLTQATTITNNANPLTIATGGTALNITGLTAGAATDSLVTVNTTTGKINRINLATLNKADSTTSSNGLNLVGKDVRLGGNLTQATTITNNANPLTFATGGTALNITGLTAGANTDSLVTVNTTTGKINRINLATLNKADSTTSSNGLNLVGKDVRLGGNLTQATTITNNANPLTIATGGTALNITGLTAGANTDSLVTVNTTTGKINRINLATLNKADSTTATNGLNLVGKDVRLGGNLTQATTITNNANPLTIATGGTALNITGLTAGANTDSLVTVNTTTGKVNRINIARLNRADSTTSSNGLNLVGKDVRLGGNLTQATTITNNANPLTIATGGTALNITGLTAGATTDSLVTVNTTTGKINRINLSILNKADSTTSSNGLNLVGKDVRLGGNLTQATTITNNANPLTIATGGTALNITGLTSGANTDSLVTVNTTTGKINRINLATLNKADSTTSSNGLNLVGKDVRLGGNLTQATTITNNANPLTIATGGTALNITGLTAGATTDSLVTVNTTTGKINRINLSILNKADSTTSSNGLNLVGKDVRLGGNLTQATTITNNANPLTIATGGTALNITGLTAGANTDSLVTVNTTTGKVNRINIARLNRADSTTSSNGLNLVGKDVRLGGNLTQATTITNNANPLTIATGGTALNITGLTAGATTDSLVTVNTTTGKINRINLSILNKADSTTSSNGLNLVGKDVRLGGNLTQATTITNNANPLTIATGGTALNITGLPSGASTDSLVVINNATGQLRKIQAVDAQPKLVEIYDVAGTQALNNVFANLNLGTITIADAGFTAASGVITVANAGLYKITFRVTVRVTNNVASGGEFQLTNAGVAIPGTLGYTFQQNNNRQQGTTTVVKIVSLTAGSTIAVQGRRYSTAGNLTLTANGSSLLIEKIR